jgi:hypothetical protein
VVPDSFLQEKKEIEKNATDKAIAHSLVDFMINFGLFENMSGKNSKFPDTNS